MYLILHDSQSFRTDREVLRTLYHRLREQGQLIVVTAQGDVQTERLMTEIVAKSCEVGVVRELGERVGD